MCNIRIWSGDTGWGRSWCSARLTGKQNSVPGALFIGVLSSGNTSSSDCTFGLNVGYRATVFRESQLSWRHLNVGLQLVEALRRDPVCDKKTTTERDQCR